MIRLAALPLSVILLGAATGAAFHREARADSRLELGVGLDLFTVSASTDGGRINSFAVVDLRLGWRAAERWTPWIALGGGLITARARGGVDIDLAARAHSGPMARIAGRYVLVTTVARAAGSFEDFDAVEDYARGPALELGGGYRVHRPRTDITIALVYLLGRMSAVGGGTGMPVDPSGAAVFHGGTVEAMLTW